MSLVWRKNKKKLDVWVLKVNHRPLSLNVDSVM